MTRSGSIQSLALGVLGIVGGSVLLAAYAVDIPGGWNPVRLVLFNIGAIAAVVGVHRRQAHKAPRLALVAAVPAVIANAAHAVMVILAIDRASPFAGGFGFAWFVVALTMWLADGMFGLITLRIGVMWRWGALVLAIGSPLAVLGMGRLGLTSPADPTIFGPLALAGVALNGLGWILLGLDLVLRGAIVRPGNATVGSASPVS